ncbi:MAG TPA: POTRA domain-containing protein, partial [Ramlibacter sp.]|nr:POTRA domain-containing protein [Ramlibacter sp.]
MLSGFRGRAPRVAARARMGVLAAAVASAGQVFAQAPAAPPMPAPAASPVFTIKGFQVTGENPLGDARTRRVLAPYVGQATIETLQKATAALEAALRERGYGLHRVALPPQ